MAVGLEGRGGGVRGGGIPPPTVYGHSNTSLASPPTMACAARATRYTDPHVSRNHVLESSCQEYARRIPLVSNFLHLISFPVFFGHLLRFSELEMEIMGEGGLGCPGRMPEGRLEWGMTGGPEVGQEDGLTLLLRDALFPSAIVLSKFFRCDTLILHRSLFPSGALGITDQRRADIRS